MPNPKTGTVTFDLADAVKQIKAGKVEFRVDKTVIIHVPVGKMSFEDAQIAAADGAARVVQAHRRAVEELDGAALDGDDALGQGRRRRAGEDHVATDDGQRALRGVEHRAVVEGPTPVAEIAESEGCHSSEGIVIQGHHSIGLPLKIVHFVPAGLGYTASPNDSNNLLRGCRATCSAAKGQS